MPGSVIVVSSFPRSGTHFLIDLLRLNFRELAHRPPLWASAEELYFNLDRFVVDAPAWSPASLDRESFVVKTHRLPSAAELQDHLARIADGRRVAIVTPLRRLEKHLASYARYAGSDVPLVQFLDGPDPFYGEGLSVRQALQRFYAHARENSLLVDVESGRAHPALLTAHLGAQLGLTPTGGEPILPARRQTHGLAGELWARLGGRQSSEVVVKKPANSASREAEALNDAGLAELDRELRELAWNAAEREASSG